MWVENLLMLEILQGLLPPKESCDSKVYEFVNLAFQ